MYIKLNLCGMNHKLVGSSVRYYMIESGTENVTMAGLGTQMESVMRARITCDIWGINKNRDWNLSY